MFDYFKRNDFFTGIFKLLRFLLIFPTLDKKKLTWNWILFVVHFTVFVMIVSSLEVWYLFARPDGFIEAVKAVGTVSYHSLAVLRMVHARLNADTYIEIYNILKRKSFNFENFNFTKLLIVDPVLTYAPDNAVENYEVLRENWKNRNIYDADTDAERNEYKVIQDEIMAKAKRRSYFCFLVVIIPAISSVVLSYLGCYFLAGKVYTDKDGVLKVRREIPYNSMHLLDINDPVNHLICLTHQFLTTSYLTPTFLVTDSLVHGIVIHMTAQLEVIEVMLSKIKINEEVLRNPRLQRVVDAQFTKCMEEIDVLIKLNVKFESFMSRVFLYSFQFATYIMCALVYALPEETDIMKFYGYGAFAVLAMIHPLIQCWNFEMLTAKFSDLSDAMYNIDFWGNGTIEFKKKLIFGIRMLQRPMKIKIGKMSVLNLEYFIVMGQKGYSMFTLFNNTNKMI